jgi:hypothetical protein
MNLIPPNYWGDPWPSEKAIHIIVSLSLLEVYEANLRLNPTSPFSFLGSPTLLLTSLFLFYLSYSALLTSRFLFHYFYCSLLFIFHCSLFTSPFLSYLFTLPSRFASLSSIVSERLLEVSSHIQLLLIIFSLELCSC